MKSRIRGLYDYELDKKWKKSENVMLKSNFHKNKNMSDGLFKPCKF